MNSTTRNSVLKRTNWLNNSQNLEQTEYSGGTTTRFMNEMINKSIDITMLDRDTTQATTSRDRGLIGSALRDHIHYSSKQNSVMEQFAIA
jgi:hypothetical protein